MNKKLLLCLTALSCVATPFYPVYALPQSVEAYENRPVADIEISVENLTPGVSFDPKKVITRLKTKVGDPFSQLVFDSDLKTLSEEYDQIEPSVELKNGKIYISLKLYLRPVIRGIEWKGNRHIKTKPLQKELGIKAHTTFNRQSFNKGFNKVKEYYIKHGYFESELHYVVTPDPQTNEVIVHIFIEEGRSGKIEQIVFKGFTTEQRSSILAMIRTQKYNFFTSWLTGNGIYNEEALDQDRLIIVNFLQNRGYADAKVDIFIKEGEKNGKIICEIVAVRGKKFRFGEVAFEGNELLSTEDLQKMVPIHNNDIYSPDRLRDAMQAIKDLYGQKGYIEASVIYELKLRSEEPVYDVTFQIDEGELFRIGLIRVIGNTTTKTSVVLHESLLTPGEVFDARLLKITQQRLENIGYFKTVNVYAVRTQEDRGLESNYRDVHIEVEETTTGNANLFFGFSTMDDVFGGLDLTENNFNYRGLGQLCKKGVRGLRGGGEYAHARVSIGGRQTNYLISWLTPYWKDTLWRVGFDVNHAISNLQSKEYDINTLGGSVFASYPITSYWTFGSKTRIRNAIIRVNDSKNEKSAEEEKNSGLLLGYGPNLTYDSTDNAFKPRRGIRSILEAEVAGIRRHASSNKMFPFFRAAYVNSIYYSVWRRGILKFRGDAKLLFPVGGNGKPIRIPLSERFFLGGETTVRGYRAWSLGPKYKDDEPKGGVTSLLLSVEYLQEVVPRFDAFIFFDGGAISLKEMHINRFNMSYGFGGRLEIMNRMPMILGMGYPINPADRTEVRRFFFSMGGQF